MLEKRRTMVIPLIFMLLLVLLLWLPAGSAESLPEGFALGVDVSELLSQESSGVVYYDQDGNPADALAVLAANGISHVRLRVWNDPFDAQGRGYGAGNIDAQRAAELSARAAALGMKTLIDFHYSDFWADPSRQIAPKAWQRMSLSQKEKALASYTEEALTVILDAGGEVDMVQIGNETNNGIAGESDPDAIARLVAAGCAAVRSVSETRNIPIKVCVHLASDMDYDSLSAVLRAFRDHWADYDAVALSYYPYWHGTLEDLACVIDAIRNDFGKESYVAETAWPFTLEDGDGSGNVISYDPGGYPVSPEGQAREVEDVCRRVADVGGTGVFYWGGIWTPVGPDAKDNLRLWEDFGSGWATRFAHTYDPEHVPDETGGSGWDNQALFDFASRPLPVLDTFRRLAGNPAPAVAAQPTPETESIYLNLVLNPGFEEEDYSMWETTSRTSDIPYDFQDFVNDAHSGTVAFHFWSEQDMSFRIQQTVEGLEFGKYEASVWSQGGDMENASMVLYVIADGQYYEKAFMNTTWADWQHPVIYNIPVTEGSLTIGVKIRCDKLGWGTLDDFSLIKQ